MEKPAKTLEKPWQDTGLEPHGQNNRGKASCRS